MTTIEQLRKRKNYLEKHDLIDTEEYFKVCKRLNLATKPLDLSEVFGEPNQGDFNTAEIIIDGMEEQLKDINF